MSRTPLERAIMLFVIIAPLIATAYSIVMLWNHHINLVDLTLLIAFYIISGIGITVGFHRMLVHRSFEPNPVVKFLFLFAGCLALEGSPQQWACTHIKHHANSDQEDDPHSPLHGFFHAHFGWLVGNKVADVNVYGKWLQQDKMVMFMTRTWYLWMLFGFLIPFGIGYAIGGTAAAFQAMFWGSIVRVCLMHHVTWSVNSICHTFGARLFETTDVSRNNFIVGILALGEGWHNNHHAFPRSAFHGLTWWQIDVSGYLILTLEKLGLVRNVYRVSPADIERRLIRDRQTTASSAAAAEEIVQEKRPSVPQVKSRRRYEAGR